MRLTETRLPGALVIELEPKADHRGFFARAWCLSEFAAHGLDTRIVQCNLGYSTRAGTIRGIHCQAAPHAEAKAVRCIRGALFDVMVDLRPDSPTYGQWQSVELTAANRKMVYIPEGFGHGYQTLADDTEILYQTSEFYHAESATGVRYDDPAFQIPWPLEVTAISETDRSWPDFAGRTSAANTQSGIMVR